MKKRRTLIIALLLIAALALGIGYAAFSSRMAINGEAILPGVQVSEVVFTDAEKTDSNNNNITVSVSGQNSNSLTVNVSGFQHVGDTVTVTAEIENPHPFEVTLTTPAIKFVETAGTQVDVSDYFDVEMVGTPPTSISAAADASTPATTEMVFKVTATDITASAKTQNFVISFLAEAS